ncbi:MAG: nitronate monooxygenase [Bacteroidetes bacterium MED-G17]|nr:MAG: nitronate monooxygenase [Bacteroidetes bacterium MED-G17]CAI8340766.1 MAG: Nitronate monooxygenase [Bacteroidetes bacterium MED-G17]|tara:strand:+ start:17360 stop:18322 length:963 start_codon:yes stop_codon:yes gene_type:complete
MLKPSLKTKVTRLFGLENPIIQAGMIWCSGWKLASAVSNAGGLGIIGSGSMYPKELEENIKKCQANTKKPFAVNVPLLYPAIEKHIEIIIRNKVPIVFTSAGNPKTHTPKLKSYGIKVVHVVSSVKFAKKAEMAGVDALVAEGFEAGGHNGREETTTLVLVPAVAKAVSIPVIAAGGIGNGQAMAACMALGAEAVQVGTRFVASAESSAHTNFKRYLLEAKEGDTELVMKQLQPVRLLKNDFYKEVKAAELRGAKKEELKKILGRARAKKGMSQGELNEGELEIGQISGYLNNILPAAEIVANMMQECIETIKRTHRSLS